MSLNNIRYTKFKIQNTDRYALTEERSKSYVDEDKLSFYSLQSSYLVFLRIVAFVHTSVGGHVAVSPSVSGSNHNGAFIARICCESMSFIDCSISDVPLLSLTTITVCKFRLHGAE